MSNPKKISFSRLDSFVQCQRKHAWDALVEKSWDTPAINRGNHVHDGLEQLANRMARGDTAAQAAEHMATHQPKGYLKENVFAGYMERAVPLFEQLKPIPNKVEAWFRDAGGLAIIGKIDLQSDWIPVFDSSGYPISHTEGLCIIDHKTTSSPARIKSPHEARKSLQLKIYCLATGAKHAGFAYYLPSGRVRGVVVQFSEGELSLAKRWLEANIETIQHNWEVAKKLSGSDNGAPDLEGYNLLPFALSEPGHPFCSAKFCDHWDRCLGKELNRKEGEDA